MLRSFARFMITAVMICFAGLNICQAGQLLTKEAALEKVFGQGVEISTETKQLTDAQVSNIKERLNAVISYMKGSKLKEPQVDSALDFYFSLKDGKKVQVAIIDKEPGKWGPVEFIIALDLQGTVTRVEVMSYQEKRGQPIARHSFLSQFEGKNSNSSLKLNKDITGISGATISSNCAIYAVKKAMILYEEAYMK